VQRISTIGIGRLGLCFSLTLEKAGYDVMGCDINPEYVAQINERTLKSPEQGVEVMLRDAANFKVTTDIEKTLHHSDILFVVVATPSLENGRYSHTQVDNLVNSLKEFGVQQTQKHLVICCTTMPGYCDTVEQRLRDYNYTVSYNPEFIAQGTILRDQARPDMVLIGEGSREIGDTLQDIYKSHTVNVPRICRMSRTEAEICKIALNCYVTTKISFANMVGDIVIKSGGDPNVVLAAIGSDSRVGPRYLGYGYGYGGPCFPRDNRALSIYAGDIGMPSDISIATDEINEKHLSFQISNFVSRNDPKIPVVLDTVTYKPGTTIIEESQQLAFAVGIAREGYNITIRENPDTIRQVQALYGDLFVYEEIA